jgi:hypothetical protein
MADHKRANQDNVSVDEPIATAISMSSGTVATAMVSLLALLMSAVSLYQTVLKQPNLHLFVPDTISYTRDPQGSFEVLVVPVTISNSGARDGVVSSMVLNIRNEETGRQRKFHATYIADQGYFSTKEDFRAGISRPKMAFAPITVAGRSGHSSTILFYPREHSEDAVVSAAGRFTINLAAAMKTVEKIDLIDRFMAQSIDPVAFEANLPQVSTFFVGAMMSGKFVRLFVTDQKKGVEAKQQKTE